MCAKSVYECVSKCTNLCVSENKNGTGAMTTAKNEVLIGLLHLVREINLWCGENKDLVGGGFFKWGR